MNTLGIPIRVSLVMAPWRMSRRARAGLALAALVSCAASPAAVMAQIATLLPTDGTTLRVSASPAPTTGNVVVSTSGVLLTPRPEASITATANGLSSAGAYSVSSFLNAIPTVVENSASRFSMSLYSGSTFSVSALSVTGVAASSQLFWFQTISLAAESTVTLTHSSTPRLTSEFDPISRLSWLGVAGTDFPVRELEGFTGLTSSTTFTAPAGTYLFASTVSRNAGSDVLASGSAITDTLQTITITPVPEPASALLMLAGAAALLVRRRVGTPAART